MDYLHNGCHNIFTLLRRNYINILIIFIEFSNIQAIWCLIIIGKYNLMCCIPVIVFDVYGDVQIVLLQKNTEKNYEGCMADMEFIKTQKSYKKWLDNNMIF